MKFIATLLISLLSFFHLAHAATPTETVEYATESVISEL